MVGAQGITHLNSESRCETHSASQIAVFAPLQIESLTVILLTSLKNADPQLRGIGLNSKTPGCKCPNMNWKSLTEKTKK